MSRKMMEKREDNGEEDERENKDAAEEKINPPRVTSCEAGPL